MACLNIINQDTDNRTELKRAEMIAQAILELVFYAGKETVASNIALDDIQGCVRNLKDIVLEDPVCALSSVLNEETVGNYTIKHSINVCILSMIIAEKMGNSQGEIIDIGTAALLHDIGKRFVGKNVIYKNGPLTDDERALVNLHPVYGSSHIKSIFPNISESMVNGILYHHERIDGRGYPDARRFGIPYCARIIAVADNFEAYIAKRPYHEKRSLTEGVQFLIRNDGLDRKMVRCLVGEFF